MWSFPHLACQLTTACNTIRPQIFKQMSNHRGTRLYKAQKKFQSVFGFTLRESFTRLLLLRAQFRR